MPVAEEFRWPVASAGYSWRTAQRREAKRRERQAIPILLPTEAKQGTTWYMPMSDEPALFRVFADTQTTRDGIKDFADRFGLLGCGSRFSDELFAQILLSERGLPTVLTPEPLSDWLSQVLSMRQAVALWDMVAAGNIAGLAQVVFWRNGGLQFEPKDAWLFPDWNQPAGSGVFPANPPWFEGLEIDAATPKRLIQEKWKRPTGLQEADYLEAAVTVVESIANDYMSPARGLIQSRLIADPRTGRPVLRHVPESLSGAIWLQFAAAVSEGKRFRTCKQCGRWFELPQRGARLPREFCTDACKSRSYRGRQDRAGELHDQGKTFKEIAAELDADTNTVKRWIKNRRKG
jgi:hypothetical protein